MTAVLIVLVATGCLAAGFILVFWILASPHGPAPEPEWLDEFSIDYYAPMQRLLDTGDVVFLASQPGYRTEIGKRLMRERRKIFRKYLGNLVEDCGRLIALGKLMVVYSSEDRAEFAQSLLRQELRFHLSVATVRLQLALHPLGWTLVDVQSLMESLQAMCDQVQELALRRGALSQPA